MTRLVWIVAKLLAFGLTAFESKPPPGNADGGVVMHGGLPPEQAFEAAQRHCQQYRKQARLTNIKVQDHTDPVLFHCVP